MFPLFFYLSIYLSACLSPSLINLLALYWSFSLLNYPSSSLLLIHYLCFLPHPSSLLHTPPHTHTFSYISFALCLTSSPYVLFALFPQTLAFSRSLCPTTTPSLSLSLSLVNSISLLISVFLIFLYVSLFSFQLCNILIVFFPSLSLSIFNFKITNRKDEQVWRNEIVSACLQKLGWYLRLCQWTLGN